MARAYLVPVSRAPWLGWRVCRWVGRAGHGQAMAGDKAADVQTASRVPLGCRVGCVCVCVCVCVWDSRVRCWVVVCVSRVVSL